MANYATLLAAIRAAIKSNDQQDITQVITGDVLQTVLTNIVGTLGAGYQFAGIATPTTNPGTPDGKVWYLAPAGSYPNFGATVAAPFVVPAGSIGVFAWSDTWTRQTIEVASVIPDVITYAECTTPAATVAKVVAADNFRLVPGVQFRVKFSQANTAANPTLNIGATGALPIVYDGEAASATNSWEAGEVVLVYYDGTSWVASISDTTDTADIETRLGVVEDALRGGETMDSAAYDSPIGISGEYKWSRYLRSAMFPLPDGASKCTVTVNAGTPYAVFTSNPTKQDGSAITNKVGEVMTLRAGSQTLDIPSGAKYLCVNTYLSYQGTTDVWHSTVRLDAVIVPIVDVTDALDVRVANLEDTVEDILDSMGETMDSAAYDTPTGISAEYKWNSYFRSAMFPLPDGASKCTVTVDAGAPYAVFTNSNQKANGAQITNAVGEVMTLRAGRQMLDVPEGAKYLCVNTYLSYQGTTDVWHSTVQVAGSNSGTGVVIIVAAKDASEGEKNSANYRCTGSNDEVILQQAINDAATRKSQVRLTSGTFYIDTFQHQLSSTLRAALTIPQQRCMIKLSGTQGMYDKPCMTKIRITDAAYNSCDDSSEYSVIAGDGVGDAFSSLAGLIVEDLWIELPWNQKPICCIDARHLNGLRMRSVQLRAYYEQSSVPGHYVVSYDSQSSLPLQGVDGCIGVKGLGGSNYGTFCSDMQNVLALFFGKGYALSGEHWVIINTATIGCKTGWIFGDGINGHHSQHPIVVIHGCDERGTNLPVFQNNGFGLDGAQAVLLIGFQFEHRADQAPLPSRGAAPVLGSKAREVVPGTWRGDISFTDWPGGGGNSVASKFWEDGSGLYFTTRNLAQKLFGTTAERSSYAPNYMQRFFDTTLGKEVICTDPASNIWVDTLGNQV